MHFQTLQEAYEWAELDCFDQDPRIILNPEDDVAWIAGNKWISYQHLVNELDTTERVVGFYQSRMDRHYILFHDPEPEWDMPPAAEETHAMDIDEEEQGPAH
jgi:hypothetical protein